MEDTIAALATPPGEGGICVVRVSGPEAASLGRAVLRDRGGEALQLEPWTVRWTRVWDPRRGGPLDEALSLWMPGPASYTREDVLEIQCHGGPAGPAVLDALLFSGARLAEPGEFTLRAYLRGRVDLLQAEAVLDVVRARTDAALKVHEELLGGALSRDVEQWQQALGHCLARLEAHLDFPEDDLGDLDQTHTAQALTPVVAAMEGKLSTYSWGRTLRDGYTVALVGAPNTGKSSLLNRLLEEDRAIVSPTPGTTRDTIEAWLNALGTPIRLVDTAGLRPARDPLEEEGVRRARAAAARADLVLLVCDGARDLRPEEIEEAERLQHQHQVRGVMNKADLGARPCAQLAAVLGEPPLVLSALTGEGIPALLQDLREAAGSGPRDGAGDAPLTRVRHRRAVEQALAALRRALLVLEGGGFPEVAASEMHEARRCLSELLGWGTPEDVLEDIFSEFCIGK
ncbi:MAG: tRNA uridine-5-carboxymethylaminomethyl(34) synthesis GTPase MnmE [Deferrisomatales bacterium]|nr:tRNA uridine-5-carboxymethylaminomethyl(34) synthesis GTPase MnmE [Deferrisomatales bacterium]